MKATADTPTLSFTSLLACDFCGGRLAVGDRIAGVCVTCMQIHFPTKARRSPKVRRERAERRR